MGKIFDKLMNSMRLNGDDYEEEYDDTYEDEYEDLYDDYDEPAPRKSSTSKKVESVKTAAKEKASKVTSSVSSAARSSKIVSLRSNQQNITEVRVVRPTGYDDAREIIDVLLDYQAAIINLEGINFDLAAQITDFIFGGCYALNGNIEKVNNYIFIVTPDGLEITGDIQSIVSGNNKPPYNYMAK